MLFFVREDAKSGLIEIIPLVCTSAIRGQYPVFSHPESPQGVLLGGGCISRHCFHPEFPRGSPSGAGRL